MRQFKQSAVLMSVLATSLPLTVHAMPSDDPVLTTVMIDRLEWRDADAGDTLFWDIEAWVGKDLDKLWIKTDGESVDGTVDGATGELLYSRAIAPYWDLQTGWRHDFRPEPERDWAAVGFKGLAPYFFDVDAFLYAGGRDGSVAASFDAEYEFLFTQRLILTPRIEAYYLDKEDPEVGLGSGLTNMEAGLRLRYEIRREFAPYVGVNWDKKFGDTADFAREEGASTTDTQWVIGVRAWF